jgi:hypothetical protein
VNGHENQYERCILEAQAWQNGKNQIDQLVAERHRKDRLIRKMENARRKLGRIPMTQEEKQLVMIGATPTRGVAIVPFRYVPKMSKEDAERQLYYDGR